MFFSKSFFVKSVCDHQMRLCLQSYLVYYCSQVLKKIGSGPMFCIYNPFFFLQVSQIPSTDFSFLQSKICAPCITLVKWLFRISAVHVHCMGAVQEIQLDLAAKYKKPESQQTDLYPMLKHGLWREFTIHTIQYPEPCLLLDTINKCIQSTEKQAAFFYMNIGHIYFFHGQQEYSSYIRCLQYHNILNQVRSK